MRVIDSDSLYWTDRHVDCPNGTFTSLRMLLAGDSMGFTLCRTVIPKGGPHYWHYKNHLEACYCISGRGLITDKKTGRSWEIQPGMCYVLDDNDPHEFTALEDVELLSIFNPPLTGKEVHDAEGSY